jgi:hypothetical protein
VINLSRDYLTSSQGLRFRAVESDTLIFEPNSKNELKNNLYSVPIGQHIEPRIDLNSGSIPIQQNMFWVTKTVHVFEREQDASLFITSLATKNISAVQEAEIDGKKHIEVHMLNITKIELSMDVQNFEDSEGYRIEVFRSSSLGLEPVNREIVFDNKRHIISDTYLKIFDIEGD